MNSILPLIISLKVIITKSVGRLCVVDFAFNTMDSPKASL